MANNAIPEQVERSFDQNSTASSSAKPWSNEPLLKQPLYVFDLPKELLANLQARNSIQSDESIKGDSHIDEQHENDHSTTSSSHSNSGCAICPNVSPLKTSVERRAHLRSDWHRYNVALNKRGKNEDILSQNAFQKIAEEISSSEGESEIESDLEQHKAHEPVDLVSTLLKRLQIAKLSTVGQENAESSEEEDDLDISHSLATKEPHLWFFTPANASKVIPQTQFGIMRQLFSEQYSNQSAYSTALDKMQPGSLHPSFMQHAKRIKGASAAEEAASMLNVVFFDASGESGVLDEEDLQSGQQTPNIAEKSDGEEESVKNQLSHPSTFIRTPAPLRTWTIILMGGGNFAAAIVALNPFEHVLSKRKGTVERQLLVLARKQFHRYTTRRKQGGSQSAQDASGKFAKSAGAQLRRYGEQQLAEEIRELLERPEWRKAILSSERVWIRAGLRSARGVLWNWSNAGGLANESPLEEMRRKDLVQNLPIAVRKPTVGECLRCFAELTKVRIRHETEEEMQSKDEAYKAQLQGSVQARIERKQKQKERLQREAELKRSADSANKKRSVVKIDPIEQLRRERFNRLVDMIRKGRVENVLKHLEKYETELLHPQGWQIDREIVSEPDDVDESMELARQRINSPMPDWWRFLDAREKGALLHGPAESIESQIPNLIVRQRLIPSTILQLAAESGHESMVNHFLLERQCDLTTGIAPPPHSEILDIDETKRKVAEDAVEKASSLFPHRTAYDLCPNRDSRDVFRRLMASKPELCENWSGMEKGGARVPKALTEEMEEVRNKEEQVRDKRQSIRERARKRQEEEALAKAHTITEDDRLASSSMANAKNPSSNLSSNTGNTNRLGGANSAPRSLQKKIDESAGLTPEMRARIEREKRARAAEARFKNLQGS